MRNILTFDVRDYHSCACVAVFYDGSDKIKLIYEADSYTTPTAKITYTEILTESEPVDVETITLTVENGFAVGEFPVELLETYYTKKLQLQYIDGDKIGTAFNILFASGTYKKSKNVTLYVAFDGDLTFKWRYISTVNGSNYSSDDFEIDEDTNELKLKQVTDMTVDKTGSYVTKITMSYEDGTSSEYECKYDKNGRLTNFGTIAITYNISEGTT